MQPAFSLYEGGNDRQGGETMGREVGVMLQSSIPGFLVKLGTAVTESGMDYAAWAEANPHGLEEIAAEFLA